MPTTSDFLVPLVLGAITDPPVLFLVMIGICAIMIVAAANIETRPHFVAELDGAVAGFYGFEPEPDGVGLAYMFVEPGFIGRGVGRALWDHAVAQARRLGHPALIVVSDPNAEGFYAKMGARRIGARPSDLEPGRSLPLLKYLLASTNGD